MLWILLANGQNLEITSEKLSPNTQKLFFDNIPPFGKKIIPIKFHSPQLLTNETYTIKINIGNDVIEKKIVIIPFYKNLNFCFTI